MNKLIGLLTLILSLSYLSAQPSVPGINDPSFGIPIQWCQAGSSISCKINRKVRQLKTIKELVDWHNNVNACLEQGYSPQQCSDAASFCFTLNTIPLSALGPFGAWANTFNLQQLLKINCGDGKCFQCCYAGGGCHSSFEGFPVINCNYNYGADAAAVGSTHVLEGEPGQLCLFTPQICTHIPQCNYNLSQQEADAINMDPNHVMKSAGALSSRRLWLASKTGEVFSKFIQRFGNLGPTGSINPEVTGDSLHLFNYGNLSDFLTGRGGIGWKNQVVPGLDWSDSVFDVPNSDSTMVVPSLSQIRATQQVAILRTLGSIPNFTERFNFVESRIWNDSSKAEYLSQVADPDAVLLQYMYPMNLQFLKILSESPYNVIQDYRLFSVPLPNEDPDENVSRFNTTVLGTPPTLRIQDLSVSGNSVSVELTTADLDLDSPATPAPLYVLWGDGTKDAYDVTGDSDITLTHEYTSSGKFQVLAVLENNSGLRAVSGIVTPDIVTPFTDNQTSLSELDIKEIYVRNVQFRNGVFTGFPSDVVLKFIGIDTDGNRQEIGRSTKVRVSTRPSELATIPYIRCEIPIGFNLDKIEMEATIFHSNASRVMWHVISESSSYWAFDGFDFILSNNEETNAGIFVPAGDLGIKLISLGNYYQNLSSVVTTTDYTDLEYLDNGLLRLPFVSDEVRYKGFEFTFPETVDISEFTFPPPLTEENILIGSWRENRPYEYATTSPPVSANGFDNRDGLSAIVYPNPTSDNSTLEFYLDNSSSFRISVVSAVGKNLFESKKVNFRAGLNKYPIETAAIPPGVYFVRIEGFGNVGTTLKLIKR